MISLSLRFLAIQHAFLITMSLKHLIPSMLKRQYRLALSSSLSSSSSSSSSGNRDWSKIVAFWQQVIKNPRSMPAFVQGNEKYGMTNLQPVFQAGNRFEFQSVDVRYTRISTYALSINYDGTKFFGYQSQRNSSARAVEDILYEAIGHRVIAAGRTDRNVSAIGQVVSFSSSKPNYAKIVLDQLRAHPAVVKGTYMESFFLDLVLRFLLNVYLFYVQYYR